MKFFKFLGFVILFFVLDFGVYKLTDNHKPTFVLAPTSFHIKELDNIEVLDIEPDYSSQFSILAKNKKIYVVDVDKEKIIETFSLDELHNPVRFNYFDRKFLVVDRLGNHKTNIVAYRYYPEDFYRRYDKHGTCTNAFWSNKKLKKDSKILNTYNEDINDILYMNIRRDSRCALTKEFKNYESAYITNNYQLITSAKKDNKPLALSKRALESLNAKRSIIKDLKPKKWSLSDGRADFPEASFVLTDTEGKKIYLISNILDYVEYGKEHHYFKYIQIIKTPKKPICSALKKGSMRTKFIMLAYKGEKGVSYYQVQPTILDTAISRIHYLSESILFIPMIPFMGRQ